jgi:ribonuclease R
MQAYYGIEPLGHFGLAFKDYTHFTSPIRRYPDLIVHRCLKTLIDSAPQLYSKDTLINIGEQSSQMERVAQKAERDLIKIKACRLLENRVGDFFNGIISGISKYGFYVTLNDLPIEGMVPMRNLTNDYYLVQEDEFSVVGRRFGKRYRLGDHVDVKVENVDIERMRIDFNLI